MNTKPIVSLVTKLMTAELGYEKFFAYGGDTGSDITEKIALYHDESVLRILIIEVQWQHAFAPPKDPQVKQKRNFLKSQLNGR